MNDCGMQAKFVLREHLPFWRRVRYAVARNCTHVVTCTRTIAHHDNHGAFLAEAVDGRSIYVTWPQSEREGE